MAKAKVNKVADNCVGDSVKSYIVYDYNEDGNCNRGPNEEMFRVRRQMMRCWTCHLRS